MKQFHQSCNIFTKHYIPSADLNTRTTIFKANIKHYRLDLYFQRSLRRTYLGRFDEFMFNKYLTSISCLVDDLKFISGGRNLISSEIQPLVINKIFLMFLPGAKFTRTQMAEMTATSKSLILVFILVYFPQPSDLLENVSDDCYARNEFCLKLWINMTGCSDAS